MTAKSTTSRAITALRSRFIMRGDVWAEQMSNGSYVRRDNRLTDEVLDSHLRGRRVVGVYQLDTQSRVKWLLFDLDLKHGVGVEGCRQDFQRQVDAILAAAKQYKLHVLIEFSGRRGYHLIVLLDEPIPAADAKAVGQHLFNQAGTASTSINVEIFPKQVRLDGNMKFGNLVKLPWGKHRLGNRSVFVDEHLETIQPWFQGQLEHLENSPVNRGKAVIELARSLPASAPQVEAPPKKPSESKAAPQHGGAISRRTLYVLQTNPVIRDLFRGEAFTLDRYDTRSGAEFALVLRLLQQDVPENEVNEVLFTAGIGKWAHAPEHYRQHTLCNAKEQLHKAAQKPEQVNRASTQPAERASI